MKITKGKLRQIIREELLREIGPGAGMAPTQQYGLGMRGGISDDTPQEVQEYLDAGKFLVQILDPTAITTLIDPTYHESMKAARKDYKAAKTADAKMLALGMLALGAAAAIPLVGKVIGIPTKAARAALKAGPKSAKAVALADKAVKNASKQPQKVKSAVESAEESAKQVAKTSEPTTKAMANRMGKGYGRSEMVGFRSAASPIKMKFDKSGILVDETIDATKMARYVDGLDPSTGKLIQRDMVVVTLPDGKLQPFYQRTGTGGASSGGAKGNWVPIDGLTYNLQIQGVWFNKARFTGKAFSGTPLERYGSDTLKQIGTWLDNATKGVKPGNITNDPFIMNGWLNTPSALQGTSRLKDAAKAGLLAPGRNFPTHSPIMKHLN